ncbi:hypothetical protein BS054_16020 [Vibrio parahaemolyticus]|nr:hypothetical protein [Vibrio parahaemolyticus]
MQFSTSLYTSIYCLKTLVAHNAALSGEQRRPPYLNHCAVNTKVESNQKCQALGIRLKRFVMFVLTHSLYLKIRLGQMALRQGIFS